MASDPAVRLQDPAYGKHCKLPESHRKFGESASYRARKTPQWHPNVVDSISCRQLYLRSYKFSRKESVPQKTKKYIGHVIDKFRQIKPIKRPDNDSEVLVIRRIYGFRRAKQVSCAAVSSVFNRFRSCTNQVNVTDHGD